MADYENILKADASKGWLAIKPGVNVIQVSHSVDGTFNVTITKPCAKGYYFQNRECIVCSDSKYLEVESIQHIACKSCSAGTQIVSGQADHHDNVNDCDDCAAGQYSPSVGDVCTRLHSWTIFIIR